MGMNMAVQVETIDETSPHLEGVKRLWRSNSKWLGYYPDGAFFDRARRREIIVAVRDGECCGYVLFYRTERRKIRLTHLCVGERSRGVGVGKLLVEALREATRNSLGIGLRCRRDFPSWSAWPKLGFVAVDERAGRSQDGCELTCFWMPHAHPSLLGDLRPAEDDRLDVVMDANIFFDLDDPTRNGAEESLGLVADWLRPLIRLCVTDELFNEIHRQPDGILREERLRVAKGFDCLCSATDDFKVIEAKAREIVGQPQTDRDAADLRQLARAIAAQATTFVTRDKPLLGHAEDFYSTYGLSVL
jgi:GNAT superfamily N-acetyltransferase